jgi:SAM-dependent MidA family methyltransferase
MTPPLGHPKLVRKLMARIEEEGPISFADFMDAALYDSVCGYYNGIGKIGQEGDYSTSPEVHPVFAHLLGRQIAQAADAAAPGEEFTVVEMGAGTGALADHLLQHYRLACPNLLARLRYLIVERSSRLAEQQQERLRALLQEGVQIQWVQDLDDVPANSITGVMFSNELVDAFPVHRVVNRALGLREIFVGWSDNAFIEIEAPPLFRSLERYFERRGVQLSEGQRADVNLHAVNWMRQVARCLRRGTVLTIDYGHTAADLFSPVRNTGTLLCYYRQTISQSPYTRVGLQDITAHVDFTTLALAGQDTGLEITGFTNQLHFLIGLGIESAFAGVDPESSDSARMRDLLRPDGMGTTYKILAQHKGMTPPRLDGLRAPPFFQESLYAGVPHAGEFSTISASARAR